MIGSVIVFVIGGIFLFAMLLAIPSQSRRPGRSSRTSRRSSSELRERCSRRCFLLVVVGCALLLPARCITSTIRLCFAIARDRAVPGSAVARVGVHATASPSTRRSAIGSRSLHPDAPDAVEQPRRLLHRHLGRNDGALHRVHSAGDPRGSGRARASRRAHGASARHYKWINVIAIVWVTFITIIFMLPTLAGRNAEADAARPGTRSTRAAHDRRRVPRSSDGWWVLVGRASGSRGRCAWARAATKLEQIESKPAEFLPSTAD